MAVYRGLGLSLVGIAIGGVLAIYFFKKLKRRHGLPKSLEIIVATNRDEWDAAFEKLSKDLKNFPVLGFDCEWVTVDTQRSPISMVQISSLSGLCVLVRTRLLLKNEGSFPDAFKDILSDKRILKVGVAPVEDGEKLMKDFGLKCFGCIDLRNFVLRCTKLKIRPGGLKKMAKDVLGLDLDKHYRIRCGNWEQEELSEGQLMYAAMDSLVSLQIYLNLLKRNFDIKVEQINLSQKETSGKLTSTCQGIMDLKFAAVEKPINRIKSNNRSSNVKDIKPSRAFEARKSPLYHNSKLYSKDGTLLCTCDTKKAKWYLERNLAEKMQDDPLCVRLLFEPASKPSSQTDYYLQEKHNVCVVCGKPDSYMRKLVIPHEYKRHLPTISKEHKSHDVVLMCVPCHLVSDRMDIPLRAYLAEKYDAKIRCDKYLGLSKEIAKVKSAALALTKDKISRKIPPERVVELENIIKEHFGVSSITDELLQKGLDLAKEKLENKDYEEHGWKVMQNVLANENGLNEFEIMWRQHFLDTMQPKFLPNYWSVRHGHEIVDSK